MHPSPRPVARPVAATIAALLVASLALILLPQRAYASADAYAYTSTHTVGEVSRDAVIDEDRQRVYVTAGFGGDGRIDWFDLATGEAADAHIALPQQDPSDIVLSNDGERLYVAHDGSGTLSIVDLTADDFPVREVAGVPDRPTGIVEDRDTGIVYVYDSSVLTRVDPVAGKAAAPTSISTERYPLIKDAVYDAANHMIWIAEGRAKVITGYSTITDTWVESIAFPVSALEIDGAAIGGRAAALAMDETLGELHIAVSPTIADDWTRTRVVSLRVADGRFVGTPIEVGENVYEMTVNPATHEILTTDGFSNTVSAISPDTWTADAAADFNAAGVTDGTGSAWADTWGLDVSRDGTRVFVSHPYSDRLSVITRAGDAPVPTERAETPGQADAPDVPGEEDAWEGPAAPAPSDAPADAATVDDGALSWAVNEYMLAWEPRPLSEATEDGDAFAFADGDGWYDATTGAADVVWPGGMFIQHYPALAPEVSTIAGNPRLQIADDGTGSLTFDVAWRVTDDLASDGYQRVTLATFADAEITRDGDELTLTATPEFTGRALELDDREYPDSYPADFVEWLDPQLRAWWLTTGAAMDAEKAPLPFTVSLTAPAAAGPEEPAAPTEPTPPAGPEEPGDADEPTGGPGGGSGATDPASDPAHSSLAATGTPLVSAAATAAALLLLGATLVAARTLRRRTR